MPYRSRYLQTPNPARQHILDAQNLHQKYGGAIDLVKADFLRMDHPRMNALLDAYGQQHGVKARSYAVSALPKWRSGQVTMAGADLFPRPHFSW